MLSLELECKTSVVLRLALTAFLTVLARVLEICLARLALRETLPIVKIHGFSAKAVANVTTSTAVKDVLLPDKLAEGYSKLFSSAEKHGARVHVTLSYIVWFHKSGAPASA